MTGPCRAFFNEITTGTFTSVGPLLSPVVNHDFQMNWALLIISKRLSLLKKLHLLSTGRGSAKRGLWVWSTPNRQVVGKNYLIPVG
jgi:hypothetical protein